MSPRRNPAPPTMEVHVEPGEQVTLQIHAYASTTTPGSYKSGDLMSVTEVDLTPQRPSRFVVVVAPEPEKPP